MEILFYIPYNDENRKLVYWLSSLYMEIVHYFHLMVFVSKAPQGIPKREAR